MEKKVVLILVRYYLPGSKSGGPGRSLANLINSLGDEFDFKVITSDRDWLDDSSYKEVEIDAWNQIGKAQVYYLSYKGRSLFALSKLLNQVTHDVMYLNSFFSYDFSVKPLLLRFLRRIPERPVILAARGELSQGALAIKYFKKNAFIYLARLSPLYRNILWQASSVREAGDIHKVIGAEEKVSISLNIPTPMGGDIKSGHSFKEKGRLKIIFLSRVSRKKNLDGALNILKDIKGDIEFDIYGPLEDKTYWVDCQKLMQKLPSNILVSYKGSVSYDKVSDIFENYHLFFLPTHGENFGHVILESLSSGCPVLISDQTPWRDLENYGCGWALPLNAPEAFKEVITRCVYMDYFEHTQLVKKAYQFSEKVRKDEKIVLQNREIFLKALI